MPGFSDLPKDARALIYSNLGPEDLSRLGQVNKFLHEDFLHGEIKEVRKHLHKVIKKPHALSEEKVSPALRILDGFAGLLWFASNFGAPTNEERPICVAVALVRPVPKSKKKKQKGSGILVAISNTGHLKLDSLTYDGLQWQLSQAVQKKFFSQVELKKYCASYQDDTSLMSARKLLAGAADWPALTELHSVLRTDVINKMGKPDVTIWDTSHNDTQKYMHAEMRILDLLWYDAVEPVDGKHVIIGISMLCCAHCEKAIRAFNQTNPKGWEVIILGGHGSEYEPSNWPGPRFLQDPRNEAARRVFFMYYEDAKRGFWATEEAKQGEDMRPLHGAK